MPHSGVDHAQLRRRRTLTAISIVLIVPLGLAMRFAYRGPAAFWVNNITGGILYEIFWMLVIFLMIPRRSAIAPIAVGVCVATCIVEVSQLWHPPWLESLRATFVGRVVLGTTFSWADFPAYPIGCLLGWLWLRRLSK